MRLIAEDVSHSFKRNEIILDTVTAEVRRGEAVAIVGPSGSGKSTLLSIMGGLLRPQSGRVLQIDNGRLLPELDVAWVLQTTNGLANRTVLDNVRLGSLSKSIPRGIRQERTLTAIAAVGLGHRRYARARSLSGGELQRMAIARALTTEAPFLLADEPTGQLDQATTRRILDVLFETLVTTGILVATHDPEVAERCHRRIQLMNGVLTPL